jgi:type I restriction enzyme S subunit
MASSLYNKLVISQGLLGNVNRRAGFALRPPPASLGDSIVGGPQNGLYKHSSSYGEGTPILRIDGFYGGLIDDAASLKRLRLTSEELEKYRLRPDDIVINRVNSPEYLGKSALVPFMKEPTVFESNMMRLGACRR